MVVDDGREEMRGEGMRRADGRLRGRNRKGEGDGGQWIRGAGKGDGREVKGKGYGEMRLSCLDFKQGSLSSYGLCFQHCNADNALTICNQVNSYILCACARAYGRWGGGGGEGEGGGWGIRSKQQQT